MNKFFLIFILLPQLIFSNDIKYSYSIVDSKAYIDTNYFTYTSIKNLYQALFEDLPLKKSFSIKERADIVTLALKNISMSQNITFTFNQAVNGENLIVAFTLCESAFKKARYFVLLSTNYHFASKQILQSADLKQSYAKWFIPILDELVYFRDEYDSPEEVKKKVAQLTDLEKAKYYLLDGDVENDSYVTEFIRSHLSDTECLPLIFEYYLIYEKKEEKALQVIPKIKDESFRDFFEVYRAVKNRRESKYIYQ